MKRKIWVILVLLLIVFVQLKLREPFSQEPLNSIEGLNGYIAQLILKGKTVYKDIFEIRPPGIFYIYSVAMKFFGDNLLTIRDLSTLFQILNTILIFGVGYFLFKSGQAGLLSAFFFALFSNGPYIKGTHAHTEIFSTFFILFGISLFLIRNRKFYPILLLLSGFVLGIAVPIKFSAVMIFLGLLLWLAYEGFRKPLTTSEQLGNPLVNSLSFLLGFLIFQGVFAVFLSYEHIISEFLFSVYFSLTHIYFPLNLNLIYRSLLITANEISIIFLGAFAAFIYILLKDRTQSNLFLVLITFLAFIGIGFYPDGNGYQFISMLPFLCLLISYLIRNFRLSPPKPLPLIFIVILISYLLFMFLLIQYPFYLIYSPEDISQLKYSTRDYIIAPYVSQEIKKETKINDKIFVCGFDPEVYFYSQRESASRYLYIPAFLRRKGGFVDYKKMMLSEIKLNPPKFIIWTIPSYDFFELFIYTIHNYELVKEIGGWRIYKKWEKS